MYAMCLAIALVICFIWIVVATVVNDNKEYRREHDYED